MLLSPPILALAVVDQENVVPEILLVNEIPGDIPEQIVCALELAVTLGFGFTVIGTVIAVPVHPDALGVAV